LKVHFSQHLPHEGCGNIGRWLRRRGHAVTRTRFERGETAPSGGWPPPDLLIIMGCTLNAHQYRDYPCLLEQRRFTERFLAGGGKVLGICHGAQVLADILGGRVHQNPWHEIGWYPVNKTLAAAQSPLVALPDGQHLLCWHGDNFDLPKEAVLLAFSAACPHQAFGYGSQILGLQFHPEIGPGDIDAMIGDCGADFALNGPWIQTEAEIRRDAALYAAAVEETFGRVLDAFVAER
jgi:GMP synthase-like glutamine amidotransferase